MKKVEGYEPQYHIVFSQYGLNRDLNLDVLEVLERRDRRLFITNSYPYCGTHNRRDLLFVAYKKEVAERLQTNLRKIVKDKHLRAGVKIDVI